MHLMVISHQDDSYRADFRFERIDLPKLANGGERVVRLVSVVSQGFPKIIVIICNRPCRDLML